MGSVISINPYTRAGPLFPSISRDDVVLVGLFTCCLILLCQVIVHEIFRTEGSDWILVETIVVWAGLVFAFVYLGYSVVEPIVMWFLFLTLFMVNRVFLDVLGIEDFGQIRNFIKYSVSREVEWRASINLIIAMLSFCIGWLLYGRSTYQHRHIEFRKTIASEIALTRVGLLGLVLCVPFILAHYLSVASFVAERGYLSYHLGQGPTKGIATYISEQISWLALAVFLAGVPTKKTFVTVLWLIVIPLLVTKMFSGARGFSMVMIVTLFWYWHYFYKGTVRLLVWIPIGVFLVFGLVLIGSYRGGTGLAYNNLTQLALYFLDGQGTSVTTLLVSIENIAEKPLSDFGFRNIFAELFMQLDKLVYRLNQSVEPSLESVAFSHGYSGYLVTYALKSDLLATGASLGTSYVTELFLAGREGAQFLGGMVFGYTFHGLYRSIQHHRLALLAFLIVLPQLLYLPRMSIFSIVSANFLPLAALLLIWMIWLASTAIRRA